METFTLTIRPDGLVKIPGTRPGQIVTVTIAPAQSDAAAEGGRFTDAQREEIRQKLLATGRQFREQAHPERLTLDHGDWLYGPDGLPK